MNFQEFTDEFLKWSEEKIEAKKIDGFPVCPYARHARLQNKVQFIDAREDITTIRNFDQENFEIGIVWLGNDCSNDKLQGVEQFCEYMSSVNPDLLYFTSTPDSGHFESNFTYCVFVQLKNDILEKRDQLHNTTYYDSWPSEYYHAITGLTKD